MMRRTVCILFKSTVAHCVMNRLARVWTYYDERWWPRNIRTCDVSSKGWLVSAIGSRIRRGGGALGCRSVADIPTAAAAAALLLSLVVTGRCKSLYFTTCSLRKMVVCLRRLLIIFYVTPNYNWEVEVLAVFVPHFKILLFFCRLTSILMS